jgi:hypothetical protein
MVQEEIEGVEIGYNFLAENGKTLVSYFDRHVSGAFGSESCEREIIEEIPLVKKKMDHLIQEIGWNGLGMFDMILCNGQPFVLELNGRLWASAKLGVEAGCDIPGFYIDHYFFKETQISESKILTGLKIRNKGLCFRYMFEKNGPGLSFLFTFLKSMLSFKTKKTITEDTFHKDSWFWLAEYYRLFKKIFRIK